MKLGQYATLVVVGGLTIPPCIATGNATLTPIAYICGLAMVSAVPSALHRSVSEKSKRQAFPAFTPNSENQLKSRGVDPEPPFFGYQVASDEITKSMQINACREAYDMGLTNVDKVIDFMRQATNTKIAHSPKNRNWVKSNLFVFKNGSGNVYMG